MRGLMMDFQLNTNAIMRHAERVFPDTEIVSLSSGEADFRYTFSDAFRRVRKLANALSKLDLQQGDRIATLAWNDHRHFELYYAISGLGFVNHTINPRLFPEQLQYIINHAQDQYIFTDPMFLPVLERLQDHLQGVKGVVVLCSEQDLPQNSFNARSYEALIAAEPDSFDFPDIDENMACAMCYTSGTTGNPKGVLYSHRSTVLHTMASASGNGFGLRQGDSILAIVPMFHVNGWGLVYTAAAVGAKLVLPGSKMGDGEALARLINAESVNLSAAVPTVWLALLAYLRKSGEKLPTLKRVVVGGAACPQSIIDELRQDYDVTVTPAWGMTETSPLGCMNDYIGKLDQLTEEAQAEARLRAGVPIFGVEFKIVDEDNRELPWDGVRFGSLRVRGPWVAQEYFNSDKSPLAEDGWLDTGDVATINDRSSMQITDRSKDVIKSGGEWISSIDLENAAVGHPAVKEAAVIGVPHPRWTERPLLLVIKEEGADGSAEDILRFLEGKVAKWWIPEACEFVDEIPHTATGKISKKDLRQQFAEYSY